VPLDIEVISGRYLEDLLHQPQALGNTWSRLRDDPVFDTIAGACDGARYQRVVLTGMGSSHFGLHPLSIELAEHGWTPLTIETSELIHYYPHLLTSSTLLVVVSQSGRSAETLRLLELNAGKATVIGVTNQSGSPLAAGAAFTVMTAAGEEYSVSCKTYVSALLAHRVLAAALCNMDWVARLRALEIAPAIVEAYLLNWRSHAAEFVELLRDVRHLFLVGRGESLAAAETGALIIKESDHFQAEGMSSAAFRHGPFEMLEPGVFVGVFAGDSKTRTLNERMYEDVLGAGVGAVLFSADAEKDSCRLPQAHPHLSPILEILPAQMMTLALAALRNREPGKFDRASKITAIE
jgi:glutamine---fructose-6-phosphate transaminase (isomerizing)